MKAVFALAVLCIAFPAAAQTAFYPNPIRQASDLVPWCRDQAMLYAAAHPHETFDVNLRHHSYADQLMVDGTFRLDGKTGKIHCQLEAGKTVSQATSSVSAD